MKQSIVWLIIVVLTSTMSFAQEITVVTEEFPPFNYQENNELKGISTEVIRATLHKAGIQADIKVYPWARLYQMLTTQPNILAFSVARMPDREELFAAWIGPIAPPIRASLMKLKSRSDISVTSLEDAKQYRVGVVRNDGGHQILAANGFEDEKQMFPVARGEQNLQKLMAGRIDLMFTDNMFIHTKAPEFGIERDQFEEAFLFMEIENYMVFSNGTSEELIERVRAAFDQVKADGQIEAITEKYLQQM